jgi:hypothetical protein
MHPIRIGTRSSSVNSVIGAILPSALGIALSPMVVIATVLSLASHRSKANLAGFIVGWLAGIAAVVVAAALLASIIPASAPEITSITVGIVVIVLGGVLLLLAFGELRARTSGTSDALPDWTGTLGDVTLVQAFLLGLYQVARNSKNLILAIAGGVIIGVSSLSIVPVIIVIAIFVVVALSTVLIVVIAYLVAAQKTAGAIDGARAWLVSHGSALVASVLFIVGVSLVGQGISVL